MQVKFNFGRSISSSSSSSLGLDWIKLYVLILESIRVPQRHTDKAEVCARAGHRLHILHRRRGGRIRRLGNSVAAVPCAHTPPDTSGRAADLSFRQGIWLLRAIHIPVPRVHKCGNGARTDARHRHPAAILQLRGIIALGVHHTAFHIPPHRRWPQSRPVVMRLILSSASQ